MQLTRLTIAAIRAAYPEPRQAWHDPSPGHTGDYCVGGAFCLSSGIWSAGKTFPSPSDLAQTFELMIPTLSAEQAFDYAKEIIDANDEGQFEEAWEILGEMLEWQEEVL